MNLIRSDRTAREMAALSAAPGRRPGRLPGGHIDDLASLRRAIWLCPGCEPKFNKRAYGYDTDANLPFVRGTCDGCGGFAQRARMLTPI